MKIPPVGAELFSEDGQTQDEANSRFSQFSKRAWKKDIHFTPYFNTVLPESLYSLKLSAYRHCLRNQAVNKGYEFKLANINLLSNQIFRIGLSFSILDFILTLCTFNKISYLGTYFIQQLPVILHMFCHFEKHRTTAFAFFELFFPKSFSTFVYGNFGKHEIRGT
jgi:hypothetical protein